MCHSRCLLLNLPQRQNLLKKPQALRNVPLRRVLHLKRPQALRKVSLRKKVPLKRRAVLKKVPLQPAQPLNKCGHIWKRLLD